MKPLHVSKLRAAVRLSQPHRDPRDGWFLLFPDFDESGRAETVLELLNSPRLVIPFIQNEDEGVRLLVRDNIDWVAIAAGVDAGLVFPPDRQAAQQQRVELCFLDERKLEATIRWGDGTSGVRLSDFLDSRDPFVAADAGFGTLMVNKRRIREVRIVEGNSSPHD